jgi:hypothetical protein
MRGLGRPSTQSSPKSAGRGESFPVAGHMGVLDLGVHASPQPLLRHSPGQ